MQGKKQVKFVKVKEKKWEKKREREIIRGGRRDEACDAVCMYTHGAGNIGTTAC